MIAPDPCVVMTRAACFVPRNTPLSSTAIVSSKDASLVSAIGPAAPTMPALLTMTSSRPNTDTARSIAAATCDLDGHVGAQEPGRGAVAVGERRAGLVLEVCHDHDGALLDEPVDDGRTDAAGPAGDHRDLAVQSSHRCAPHPGGRQ